ncbi:MAG: hypothetical protein P1U56_22865 [Saprospiraceae bacterium]|nr:hypothetical protein [Saprospiraceae bacterium]
MATIVDKGRNALAACREMGKKMQRLERFERFERFERLDLKDLKDFGDWGGGLPLQTVG